MPVALTRLLAQISHAEHAAQRTTIAPSDGLVIVRPGQSVGDDDAKWGFEPLVAGTLAARDTPGGS
jgi:hypothetical protein